MRFSLIGDLAEASLLVHGISCADDCQVGAVCVRGDLLERLSRGFPADARRVESPEDALYADDADAVIVAESNVDESMSRARQASQTDRHVIVIPPDDASTAFSYELHLLLDESRRGILVLSGRWYLDESVSPVSSDVRDAEFGLPSPLEDPNHRRTLLHAVDQAAALGFGTSQVTVLDVAGSNDELVSRQVMLSDSAIASWHRPGVAVNCSHAADRCRVRSRASPKSLDRTVTIPSCTDQLSDDAAVALCRRMVRGLESNSALQEGMQKYSESLQLGKAMDDSVRRRRTIDVYLDGVTERSVFKTQMTAIGCGVLSWLMVGLIGFLLVAELNPPRAVLHLLRILWMAPVVIFLAAQLLLPLARGRSGENGSDSPGVSSTDS